MHAAILHFLGLFLCFPEMDFDKYALRNIGNRSLEALHGTFRGSTCSLPINTPNLSFREFLDKMNQMVQINQADHDLRIQGNSIKKEKETFAVDANEPGQEFFRRGPFETRERNEFTYDEFQKVLIAACNKGDEDSK